MNKLLLLLTIIVVGFGLIITISNCNKKNSSDESNNANTEQVNNGTDNLEKKSEKDKEVDVNALEAYDFDKKSWTFPDKHSGGKHKALVNIKQLALVYYKNDKEIKDEIIKKQDKVIDKIQFIILKQNLSYLKDRNFIEGELLIELLKELNPMFNKENRKNRIVSVFIRDLEVLNN